MERNADRYTMVAVTLPGFGGTPRPDLPLNTDGTPWRDNALRALSELIDAQGLDDVVVVGNSFGTMVGVQLAALRPDKVKRLINVDGSLFSSVSGSREEQLAQAAETVATQTERLADPEVWRTFNGGPSTLGPPEQESYMARHRSMLYHGMFMATDRTSLIQYWRENLLIDLDAVFRALTIPVLDIQSFRGGNFDEQRRRYEESIIAAGKPDGVKTVYLEDTGHFVMEHRPELFDRMIADYLAGRTVQGLRLEPSGENAVGPDVEGP